MDKEKSPLQELLGDERMTVHETIKNVLGPLLTLSMESDQIFPRPEFQKLTIKQKIVTYLLARQAMKTLGVVGANESAPTERIAREIMADKKTVGEQLSRLKGKLIVRSNTNEWFLPNNKILLAADFIKGGSDV